MKKFLHLCSVLLIAMMAVFAAPQSQAVVKATNVFTGKLIKTLSEDGDKVTYVYNEQSQLTSVEGETFKITFDYTGGCYKDDFTYDVKMSAFEDGEAYIVYYIKVGSNNFASALMEEDLTSGMVNEWTLAYNEAGQLSHVTYGDKTDVREITITYQDGNIVSVDQQDSDYTARYEISYADKIENKAQFMLFDLCFCIDLDDFGIAYFAGLLGNPTKWLPQATKDLEDGETDIMSWTISETGYPSQLVSSLEGTMQMTWMGEDSGVPTLGADDSVDAEQEYFTITGVKVAHPSRGVYIVRKADGSAAKVIR